MRRGSSSTSLIRRLINAGAPSRSASASATQAAVVGRDVVLISRPPCSVPPLLTRLCYGTVVSSSSSFFQSRALSSSSANICLINSEEQFSSALNKIQEESSPAILYFTAAWCGPCRLMSPVLEDLSGKYPSVTTYKIDIDQKGVQDKLLELKIDSVPRLHFFKDGKKVDEIIGADIGRLKYTMEKLYE